MLRNLGVYHNPLKFMNFFYNLRQRLFSGSKTIHFEKEGFKICFYLFEAQGNQRILLASTQMSILSLYSFL